MNNLSKTACEFVELIWKPDGNNQYFVVVYSVVSIVKRWAYVGCQWRVKFRDFSQQSAGFFPTKCHHMLIIDTLWYVLRPRLQLTRVIEIEQILMHFQSLSVCLANVTEFTKCLFKPMMTCVICAITTFGSIFHRLLLLLRSQFTRKYLQTNRTIVSIARLSYLHRFYKSAAFLGVTTWWKW